MQRLNLKERFVRKIIMFLSAFMLLSLVVPMQARAEEEYEVTQLSATAEIEAESLNVRSGPSQDYSVVGKAKAGETYQVTGQADTGWYQIDYNGTTGYVAEQYVTVSLSDAEESNDKEQSDESQGEGPGQGGFSLLELADRGTLVTGTVIGVVILILLVCIIITVKKMINGEDDDEEDDDEEDDDEEDTDEKYDGEEDDGEEDAADKNEEDVDNYRVYIDPRYFEDVTPYEEEEPVVTEEKTEKELEEAMKKLNELQKEIERIKEKKDTET